MTWEDDFAHEDSVWSYQDVGPSIHLRRAYPDLPQPRPGDYRSRPAPPSRPDPSPEALGAAIELLIRRDLDPASTTVIGTVDLTDPALPAASALLRRGWA